MVVEKIGELPVNSRIFIDYSEGTPKINFEYPDKDTSVLRRSSSTMLIALVIALLISSFLIVMYSDLGKVKLSDININQAFISNNNTLLVNYSVGEKTYYAKISPSTNGILWILYSFSSENARYSLEIMEQAFIIIILFISLIWIISYILGFFFKNTKVGQRTFPELNKKMHDKHYSAEFTPEDIVDNKVELPLFKNMYMDYEATGDCSAQLIKISIIEHPFSKLVKRHGHYMYKKEKKKPQVYLWKAIFEFKEKPKDGKLEIHFT